MCELSRISLSAQIFSVMLAGFEDEVLKLLWISIGCEFTKLFAGYLHCFPLIGFFFGHIRVGKFESSIYPDAMFYINKICKGIKENDEFTEGMLATLNA